MKEDAKIIGITPAIASFNGMCVFCAPTIFLPTTFLEYCTGTFLSACCTNTTAAIKRIEPKIIPNAIKIPSVLIAPPWKIKFVTIYVMDFGKQEIIPTKIIMEMPFPIPLVVICSPSQISNAVPAIKDRTTNAPVKTPESTNKLR